MSNPLIVQYPFDKTGTSATNKIEAEVHEINGSRERAFVPQGGPFYTESMVIRNTQTGVALVPVDDYILCQPFQQASLRTGKDVQCVIWLKTATPISVTIDYQVVGGEFSFNITALLEMIAEIDIDGRPVAWGSVIGRPIGYPPAPHIHDIGDTYGWEYVVYQLEGIRNAILVGDEASHDELRQQMQSIRDELEVLIRAVDVKVDDHLNNMDNPHQTTKAQVGLGLVQNFQLASQVEATAGTMNNRYMTPLLTSYLVDRMVTEALATHLNDFTNPHKVTQGQVGLGLVQNFGVATQAEANAGVVNDKYMTPLRTAQAIATLVGNAFNAHVANVNNPHQTTKAHVGLSLVDNFGTATVAEAQVGTATNKFMTPALTEKAIQALVGNAFNAHVANLNNPHQTTKAHVGLGLVDNYPTANKAEAEEGTSDVRFMTPLRTKQLFDKEAANMNAHIANLNNPHQTTKAHVGLGLIPNAITRARGSNTDAALLTAGGMYDHVNSGDHDGRYTPRNTVGVDGSTYCANGRIYIALLGAWRQVWPAQWSA